MRFLALLALTIIALSGCGGVPTEQTFTVPDDAPATTDAHTGDGYDLRVYVKDENGTPVRGAAVVLFSMKDAFGGTVEASASAGEEGARTVAFWEAEFTQYDTVAGLRTNQDGWAEADLKPNSQIHVAAGDADGLTTEVRTNVALGGGGQSGSIHITLYPETITYSYNVNFGNHAGTGGVMAGQREAYEIAFSDDGQSAKAYRNRIYDLEATATWTNGLQQGADLHIGIGDASSTRWTGADKQQYVNDGTHTETVKVTSVDLDDNRADLAAAGYHAYIITDWVSLGFSGVDVTIDVTATLKGSNIRIQS